MKGAVAAVLLLAGILIGVGVAFSDVIVGDPQPTVVVREPPPRPPPTTTPPDTTPTADAGVAVPVTAQVVAVRGKVLVRRGEGEWADAVLNATLGPDDALRAGRNAEATLRLGDGVEVRLSPRSDLSVRELSEAVSKVRLDEGHVTATVTAGGRALRVAARGSDAEAESKGGTFGVVTDGRGTLAVAATTGTVRVSAAGAAVDVNAGEATTVSAGATPAAPTASPSSLFLKLGALGAPQTNQTTTVVSGTTAPGALVRVGDSVVTSDASGRFSMKVPLRDGRNELSVDVIDANGRREDKRLPPVMVDRVKPPIDANVQWGRPN
jgi:hypothetical protein